MARQGLFGDLKHAECAYIHNLSHDVLWQLGSEGGWRRNYHTFMDGNLYPTHGLGPVAQYLNIGRGDAFKFVPEAPVDWLLCDVIAAPERSVALVLDWVRQRRCRR